MNRNVLLVVIDQFRADCLYEWASQLKRKDIEGSALNGGAQLAFPNLQQFMQEATTFTQHYTVTTPCGPSRASLLTGMYAMNHRSVRNGTPLAHNHRTLGQSMRCVGYEPWLFGYTDASADPFARAPSDPDLKDYEGLSQGFAERLRMRLESPGPWVGHLKAQDYDLPEDYWDIYKAVPTTSMATEDYPMGCPISSPALYRSEDSDTAFLTDRTLETLSAEHNKNWFSMVTYIKPHPPIVAPSPYNQWFARESIPTVNRSLSPEQLRAQHPLFKSSLEEPCNTGLYNGFDGFVTQQSANDIEALRAVYLGLAAEVDHHIGRLISFLKDTDQYDNTLVIVTADHGEMLGDHYLWGKNFPFDSALRIPLIIRDPFESENHGRQVNELTESVDIAPTILSWCESDIPSSMDGQSLLPLCSGGSLKYSRNSVFAEAELGEPHYITAYQKLCQLDFRQCNYAVIRDKQYKYVHFNGDVQPMLFDVVNDPLEKLNLVNDSAYHDVLMKLRARMLDHRMTYAEHSRSEMALTRDGIFSA